MSENKKKPLEIQTENGVDVIDPIYQKYAKSVIRALGSTTFYEYFMEAIGRAQTEIQFSNRRMEKLVDLSWLDAIEEALPGLQNIIASPRNVIREDELIVNVANAKKSGSDVVRHLAMHASFVEDFNEESGDVRPNKLMQKFREDSIGQVYENRVAFTALEMVYQFVKIRHDAIFEAMGDEFGAKLRVKTDMNSSNEFVHMESFLHIRDTENAFETDEKNKEVFDRISRLYRILSVCINSHFARHMSRYPRVTGSLVKTNALKKNPNYRAAVDLLEYLKSYESVGYAIKVIEQNPVVDEQFQQDIYHNILFNYLVLKGHLERDKDRRLPAPLKEKKHTLKPKFIKEIIEELTEDYDLPDVEIRKVLIEELTKEQLMQEEAAERRRLVEEQAQKKKEEEARLRREREAEKERLRQEREAEKERLLKEKEAEKQRQLLEQMERDQEDRRRSMLFRKEILHFTKHLEDQKELRAETREEELLSREDFEDAAYILEETERLKREEADRARARRREERDRQRREEFEAQQRALAEEAERRERQRLDDLAEAERQKREQDRQEALIRAEREKQDMEAIAAYLEEVAFFRDNMSVRRRLREDALVDARLAKLAREEERRKLLEARKSGKRSSWRFGRK